MQLLIFSLIIPQTDSHCKIYIRLSPYTANRNKTFAKEIQDMKITRRSIYMLARDKGLVTATKPDEPGKRYWFANQQHKRVSPQKGLNPEEAVKWLVGR
jgi:hypothetical protein